MSHPRAAGRAAVIKRVVAFSLLLGVASWGHAQGTLSLNPSLVQGSLGGNDFVEGEAIVFQIPVVLPATCDLFEVFPSPEVEISFQFGGGSGSPTDESDFDLVGFGGNASFQPGFVGFPGGSSGVLATATVFDDSSRRAELHSRRRGR